MRASKRETMESIIDTGEALPVPDHFLPESVGKVWRVPYQDRASEARQWAKRYGLKPAAHDETRLCLLLIDVQNTFCM